MTPEFAAGRYIKKNYRTVFAIGILMLIFHSSIRQSYVLFHSIVELLSIIIAFAVFIITWNSRKMIDNNYLHFIGLSYLFIGSLDLMHTLSFEGMPIFRHGTFYANQFWVATRSIEAVTLTIGFYFFSSRRNLNENLILLSYFTVTLLVTFSIIVWHNFPVCYIQGAGQTMFKIIAEYIIILILLVACLLLYKNKHRFSQEVYKLLFSSFIFTILSEFCFTLYVSNSSTANEYGHYFKLIAFFLIYKSNVVTGFSKPTELIFKNLKDNEEKYRNLAENLKLVEQELKELNATKDKLFSIIAHDLKNPFTSLISYSELIYKNADKLSQEKVHHMARRMNHSAKQAYVLLDNLLSWSRVQTGLLKPKSEVVYATDLVNEAKQLADAFGQIKGIGIEVCSSSVKQLKTDPQMINTVLRNLVSNAIKFSHANSSVVLKTADKENCVEFAVCDFGVGIDMAHQPDILSMKNSVSRPGTSDETGTGLGLLLCREFVELCGGKIWFESEPGKGTTFYFTIPFEASVKVL